MKGAPWEKRIDRQACLVKIVALSARQVIEPAEQERGCPESPVPAPALAGVPGAVTWTSWC